LRGARLRKRLETGRCEGPNSAPEAARKLAQELHGTGLRFLAESPSGWPRRASYRLLASTTAWRRWCALHPAATDIAHTCYFRIVLPADTATVLAYMAHHNTAEQMRANIWRAVLIRIVTALVESRCQITPVDVTTLAETPVGQTFKTAFIPEVCDIHFASAADTATAKLFFADEVVGGP
jgi:hypothetical protein